MSTLRSWGSALASALEGPDRGKRQDKADASEAGSGRCSEQDAVRGKIAGETCAELELELELREQEEEEEEEEEEDQEGYDQLGRSLPADSRSLLKRPTAPASLDPLRSSSDLPGFYFPIAEARSEYHLLGSSQTQIKSRSHAPTTSTTFNFRHSRCCGLTVLALTMLAFTTLLTTLLVFTHRHRALAANIDFTVNLGYSTYTGISAADDEIVKWLGIRYAAPPVGSLRFKAPQAPLVNQAPQLANTYGNVCLPTPSTGIASGFSEDCLFLNVYAPVDSSKTRPVYVFIQGGGFNGDSNPNLNGAGLIEAGNHDLIVVDFNYRVGPWGFLASKEVQAGGDLNAGLLDQRFVLQWVQTYIHLFGGDPTRVTLGGASAGAASVTNHLSAYGGRDDKLFARAAAESQSFGTQLTVAESQYQYDALVARVGCNTAADTLQCLRNLDTNVIAQQNSILPLPGGTGDPVFMYSEVIDGNFLQDYTYNLFATGRFIKVPTIFGADTNDGTVFTPKSSSFNNYGDVNVFLKNNFPKLTASELAEIDSLYPPNGTYPDAGPYWRTAANAYGDMRYMCPGIWLSTVFDIWSAQGWNYHWDVAPQSNIDSGLGVTHVDELYSIWNVATAEPEVALNPIIQAYWSSFIRTGDPNTLKLASAPTWQKMDGTSLQRIHFVDNPALVAMEDVPLDFYHRCNYLTTIGGQLGQ